MEPLQAANEGLSTSVVTDVFLPLSLALIMFGMGLALRPSHFRLLGDQPQGVVGALVGQILLLPLAAMLVVVVFRAFFGLSFELAVGLLLLAAVPGGATSNVLTWLCRGDTAMSVTLTAITSVGSFILAPVVLFTTVAIVYGDATLISVPFSQVLGLTLVVVAGPVVIGMLVGRRVPTLATKVDRPLRLFSIAVLAGVIGVIIYENRAGFWGFAAATVPAAFALNVLALGAGFLVSYLFRLGPQQRRAAVIEVGFQNGTFAILLAVNQLDSARAALMPGFYSLMMYVTGGLLAAYWMRKRVPMRPLPRPNVA